MLRALIVDDEAPARAELRFQLEAHPDVAVIGEAARVSEALHLVGAVEYDVLFLDIAMPGTSGLELARTLHDGRLGAPFVVFITAHDEHALRAFGLSAVDYLLKPVSQERLAATLDRLRFLSGLSLREASQPAPQPEPPIPASDEQGRSPRFLPGLDGEKTVPIPLTEVAYLTAEDDTVFLIRTDGRRYQVRSTLRDLERLLPANLFIRCHRSYIVNLHEVQEIVPFFNGTYLMQVKGAGDQIPVSRQKARQVKRLFRFP